MQNFDWCKRLRIRFDKVNGFIRVYDGATISDKNYGKNLLFWQFRVSNSFPLLTMLRNNEQNLRQAMLWVRNIV